MARVNGAAAAGAFLMVGCTAVHVASLVLRGEPGYSPGCDFAQGSHFSRPLPASALAEWFLTSCAAPLSPVARVGT